MARAKSVSNPIISRGPYTSPWAKQTTTQPRTPLLDPNEANKPWPLSPFTNPYLWPTTAEATRTLSSSKIKAEWGRIDENVEFPNGWSESIPSQNPTLPKSLGCVTYTLPSSFSSPLSVGLFTTYPELAFPTTYKALSKLFLSHCKLQRHANATIDASDRRTLLASSPFVALRRYRSDVDKETESLNTFIETEYHQAVANWKTGELHKLQREKAIKAGIDLSGGDFQTGDATIIGAQEMVEIEHAMMAFRKEQNNRHLCTVSTQLLDRDALIIDAYQLWDALVVRSFITENDISEEEVRGVFLVWKKVPKEAIVSYEPMVEKKELETRARENIATTKPTRNYRKVSEKGSPIKTRRKTAKIARSNSIKPRPSTRFHPFQNPPTQSIPATPSNKAPSKSTLKPTRSTTIRKSTHPITTNPKKTTKIHHHQEEDQFAVADVLNHAWGFWKKKAGLYVRDRKGTLYREYLVKWAGEGYEDTWEPEPNLGVDCLNLYWKLHGPEPQVPPVGLFN